MGSARRWANSGLPNNQFAGGGRPEAQVVDSYEIGWRGGFQGFDASAAVFYNTSNLGTPGMFYGESRWRGSYLAGRR